MAHPRRDVPPPPQGRSPKGQRTRARILDVAEEVFGREGFHDASIAEITQRAGIAQGSFYVHFPSKMAIFEELIRTRAAECRRAIREAADGASDARAAQERGLRAYFAWISEHPWIYRAVRQAEFVRPELREEWFVTFAQEYTALLRREMKAGAIQRGDAEVLAWAIMGMSDFTAMRWIVWDEAAEIPRARLNAFIEVALRALGHPPVGSADT